MGNVKQLYQTNNAVLSDSFDRIVAEIHIKKQKDGINSFLIAGCEPGVGTTTLSISLAIAMAKAGWKTLLVDADMRKIAADKRLGQDKAKGLSDYLLGEASEEAITCGTNYENLSYIGSGVHYENAVSLLCSVKMKDFMHRVSSSFDYVIIDSPALNAAVDGSLLATQAQAVVLVTAHETGSKKNVEAAKKQLDRVEANIAGIVVNKVSREEFRRVMKHFDYFKKQKYIHK